MKLEYCHWYYGLAPDVAIKEFFEAPVINRQWRVTRKDNNLVRFGLMWKLYDLVAGLDFKLPILDPCEERYTWWIYWT